MFGGTIHTQGILYRVIVLLFNRNGQGTQIKERHIRKILVWLSNVIQRQNIQTKQGHH